MAALISVYEKSVEQMLQHENQRERMTSLIFLASAAIMTGLSAVDFNTHYWFFGLFLVYFGWFGRNFSLKHYERSVYHISVITMVLEQIDHQNKASHPQDMGIVELMGQVGEKHRAGEFIYAEGRRGRSDLIASMSKRRLHMFWAWMNTSIMVSGLALTGYMLFYHPAVQKLLG